MNDPWIWSLAFVAISLLAAVHVIRALLSCRHVRAVVAANRRLTTALRAGRVTLRGVWRGPSVRTAVHGDDRLTCEVARGAWLDCDGERIEIAGAVRVVLGTRTDDFHLRRPDLAPEAMHPIRVAAVADGDRVIISGVAAQTAPCELDYRHSAHRWTLSPRPFSPMRLVAETPATTPPPLDLFALLAIPTVLGVLAYCAMRIAAA